MIKDYKIDKSLDKLKKEREENHLLVQYPLEAAVINVEALVISISFFS